MCEIRGVFVEWQEAEECPRKNRNSYFISRHFLSFSQFAYLLIDLYIDEGWEVSMRENVCILIVINTTKIDLQFGV